MLFSPKSDPPGKIPLRLLLSVPFVALLAFTVALTGYLSFRNTQNAMNEILGQLRGQLAASIEDHLTAFMSPPHVINQINANALRQGLLDARDAIVLERHFWGQLQVYDSVTSIYFGNTAGGLVDAGREGPSDFTYVIATDGFIRGSFKKYATDHQGHRTDLLVTVPEFDASARPWHVKREEALRRTAPGDRAPASSGTET